MYHLPPLSLFCLLLTSSVALADERKEAEDSMNNSSICPSLPEFNVHEIAKILGYDLPKIPFLDTDARWDKNRHRLGAIHHDGAVILIEGTLGCQPSDQSAVIKALPISADDVRMSDNFRCNGTKLLDGNIANLSCSTSGELGKILAQHLDLSSQIMSALNEVQ